MLALFLCRKEVYSFSWTGLKNNELNVVLVRLRRHESGAAKVILIVYVVVGFTHKNQLSVFIGSFLCECYCGSAVSAVLFRYSIL